MIVSFNIPQPQVDRSSFLNFWLNTMFVTHVSPVYQVNSLTLMYVRLVDAALIEYELGRQTQLEYWNTHSGVALGAMYRSGSHFESCVTNAHRAKKAFSRLRNHPEIGDLGPILRSPRAEFAKARFGDRLAAIRNEIHHAEDSLMDSQIVEGLALMLRADGPETPHESEVGQTNKLIDRLTVGRAELLLEDLANALAEMAQFVSKISAHVARDKSQAP